MFNNYVTQRVLIAKQPITVEVSDAVVNGSGYQLHLIPTFLGKKMTKCSKKPLIAERSF